MELLISIGQRLREVRIAAKLSQSDFAAIAAAAAVPGATRQSQAKYEKGLQSPNALYLAALAARGIDIGYVITGKNQQQRAVDSAASVSLTTRDEMERAGLLTESPASYRVTAAAGSGSSLNGEEQALIDALRQCTPEDRDTIVRMAERLKITRKPKG